MARKFRKPPHDEPKPSGIGSNKGGQNEYGDLIKFSFKYLNLTHNKFHYSDREAIYFMKLIERMQNLSTFKALEAKTSLSKPLRFHGIDWSDTTEESFGLPNEEQLVDKPWQFEISANEHGRVHGFFIGNVFNVVWFDPRHLLYS